MARKKTQSQDNLVLTLLTLVLQALIMNDVQISPEQKILLYEKHVSFVENHGKNKNAYVIHSVNLFMVKYIKCPIYRNTT